MATDATIIQLVATPALNAVTVTALATAPLGMTCLSYMQPATIQFYASKTNSRNTATKVGESPASSGVFLHKGLNASETWYYWARATDAEGNTGAFYPTSSTSGVSSTTQNTAPGPNSIGEDELKSSAVTSSKIASLAVTNAKISDLSASKLTAGTINATLEINGPTITGGIFRTATGGGRRVILGGANHEISVYNDSGQVTFSTGTLGSYDTVTTDTFANKVALYATNYVNGSNAHAIRGRNSAASGGHGIVGVSQSGGGWAFFAQAGSYGPFTGGHDALLLKGSPSAPGDIVVDSRVLARDGIDNALTEVVCATQVAQRGAVGVISKRTPFDPGAHLSGLPHSDETFLKQHFASKFDRCTVNGVGEGQVNVCGRGGNFDLGDLIVTSDLPGKGQRQVDDIVRSYTVARIREAVTFDHPDQVKRVACIYLAG